MRPGAAAETHIAPLRLARNEVETSLIPFPAANG